MRNKQKINLRKYGRDKRKKLRKTGGKRRIKNVKENMVQRQEKEGNFKENKRKKRKKENVEENMT